MLKTWDVGANEERMYWWRAKRMLKTLTTSIVTFYVFLSVRLILCSIFFFDILELPYFPGLHWQTRVTNFLSSHSSQPIPSLSPLLPLSIHIPMHGQIAGRGKVNKRIKTSRLG